jgi:hypothetical protein
VFSIDAAGAGPRFTKFAEFLAQANGRTARPDAQRMTVEVWAPLGALLFGVTVLLFWTGGATAPSTSAPTAAKAASAPAGSAPAPTPAQPTQPKKPVPAPAPAAKKH